MDWTDEQQAIREAVRDFGGLEIAPGVSLSLVVGPIAQCLLERQ